MIGKIFITRTGYDPQMGRHIKEPFLSGETATFGACRPDIRKQLGSGDHVFLISGKVKGYDQFVVGGFEIDKQISVSQAYQDFPEQRLRQSGDGRLAGNIVVDSVGAKHPLDDHRVDTFGKRIENYTVGKNVIVLEEEEEISRGREQTMDALQDIMNMTIEHDDAGYAAFVKRIFHDRFRLSVHQIDARILQRGATPLAGLR